MTILKKIIAIITIIGVLLMTTPNIPVENSGDLALPEAIQGVPVSSVVARIGQVVDIVESDNITVSISGSPTLVNASYLFPQYQPLLGDYVYLTKQDAQWAVLGTLSGPVNSLVRNPSFEEGTVAALPTDWTLQVNSSGAGVPTFTKVTADNPVSGGHVADFGVDNVGAAALSEADAISASVPAVQGSKWAAAVTINSAFISMDSASQASEGAPTFFSINLEFLDGGGASISNVLINTITLNSNVYTPIYMRPSSSAPYVVAPTGTEFVRVRLEADFFMSATSFSSVFVDNVLLRTVA